MLIRHALSCLSVGIILAAGCSAPDPEPAPVSKSAEEIFGGSLDSAHTSVVAVINTAGGACSGTIIHRDGDIGYVLTAAHCVVELTAQGDIITPVQAVDPSDLLIVPGQDYETSLNASTYYPVPEFLLHPSYNGQTTNPNDVAVVRFYGADGSTPTTPITSSPDGLSVGEDIEIIGYGRTETSTQNNPNTQRNTVTKPVSDLSNQLIEHNRNNGSGHCQGDSGGPVLTTGGSQVVVGVNSWSAGGNCNSGFGYAVRVTNHLSFITDYINGTPSAVDCNTCFVLASTSFGGCTTEGTACNQGTPCGNFLACANNCPANDSACVQQCSTDNPGGQAAYVELIDCACVDCPTECGSEPICEAPMCGLTFPEENGCDTCMESSCCTETQDCTDDTDCRGCATGTEPQGFDCSTVTLLDDLFGCLNTSCRDECGGSCGFSNDGACGECIESAACCDLGAACANDATCLACASGQSTNGCDTNQAFEDLFTCLAQCDGDPCGAAPPATGGTGGMGTGGAGQGGGSQGGNGGGSQGGNGGSQAGSGQGGNGGGGQAGSGQGGAGGTSTAGTAGTSSAGTSSAGTNGGSTDSDGSDDSGCSCSTPASTQGNSSAAPALLLALGLLFGRRRRAQ